MRHHWGIVGLGEVGQWLAARLTAAGDRVAAYTRTPARVARAAERLQVDLVAEISGLSGCDAIISTVWPDAAVAVAAAARPHLGLSTIYADLNNISPQTVTAVGRAVGPERFVKVAVMASVAEDRVPLLAGGLGATGLVELWRAQGLQIENMGVDPQRPAALKILRALTLKGIAALLLEAAAGAHRYGVADLLLTSTVEALGEPGLAGRLQGWSQSSLPHARRRAAEMEEIAAALTAVGVAPHLTGALRAAFLRLAEVKESLPPGARPDWAALLDLLGAPAPGNEVNAPSDEGDGADELA